MVLDYETMSQPTSMSGKMAYVRVCGGSGYSKYIEIGRLGSCLLTVAP